MGEWSGAAGCCPRCGDGQVTRCGHAANGVQRWQCGGCGRGFTARRWTALAGLHDEAAFGQVLADMLGDVHSSCRALAKALGLDKSTIWRWRQRINRALAQDDQARVATVLRAMPLRLRESRKASREWVNHRADPARYPAPDRPRWVDVDLGRLPPPSPIERFLVTVAVGRDLAGDGLARVRAAGAGGPSSGDRDQLECHPGHGAPSGEATTPPAFVTRGHPAGTTRFKAFLAPFRGPATRHLAGYAAWFTICCEACVANRQIRAWRVLNGGSGSGPTFFADMRGSAAGPAWAASP